MPNLIDELEGPDNQASVSLHQTRLGKEPVMVLLFTAEVENAALHFEGDEAVFSYLPCPGKSCPLCYLGSAPQQSYLLPVLNLESREVEVLRIPSKRGPETLAAALKPHLKDPDIASKVLLISRNVNRYRVEARPLARDADHGADVVAAFKTASENGLQLVTAFPRLSAAEIAEVERVRRKLDAIGGWSPPQPDTVSKDVDAA
jgi:hypothetical protein